MYHSGPDLPKLEEWRVRTDMGGFSCRAAIDFYGRSVISELNEIIFRLEAFVRGPRILL
jgi:hypothetical protein